MDSARGTAALPAVGFPIRTSPDQSLVSGSPTLFAATHVLLRLLSPRHPSCALCSLVISLPAPSPSSRRPGSSAASWLTDTCRTTHSCLLAHMQLSKNRPLLRSCCPGGADRDRTDDIQLAKLALSQLSYGPKASRRSVVGLGRFELPTPRLSSVCSNQLSYRPLTQTQRPRISKNQASRSVPQNQTGSPRETAHIV